MRLLLCDDHTLFREAIAGILRSQPDMEVVGLASTGREAIELVARHQPDVVLMDVNMPELDGVRATETICKQQPRVNVVILTMFPEDEHAFEAVKAGARGYLVKTIDTYELVRSIRSVHAGHTLVSADVAMRVLEDFRGAPRTQSGRGVVDLSEREKDILRLLSKGATNQEIARQMFLSEKTIENRLSVIFQKLQINNRVQAALYALKTGLAAVDAEDEEVPSAGGGFPRR
ncbi:MAG: response regulator transcription factor [Chloroflexota bacterium]|nr:response regulator transcription factor [Chloroflexota bacterium]